MNARRIAQLITLTAAMLVMSACAGVPFATLWHYRSFGPEDFLQTDPSALRAAIQLDDGVTLGSKPPELNVRLQFKNEAAQTFPMPLKVLKQGPWVGAGSGGVEPGKHWYLLALSDEGVRQYRHLQAVLAKNLDAAGHFKKHGSFTLAVNTGRLAFTEAAGARLKQSRHIFTQTRLELAPKDGFYTLYKGEIKVSMKTSRKLSSGT